MPEIMVWLISSVRTRNDETSCASRLERNAHFFLVGLGGWGSTACEITGSGKVMCSRMMTCAGSVSVSPVVISFDADRGGDVAGVDLADFAPFVGVHLQDAAQPLFLLSSGLSTESPDLTTPE